MSTLPAISDPRAILRAVREKQSKAASATLAAPAKTLAGGGEREFIVRSVAYDNSSQPSRSSHPAIPRHNSSRETTIERNRLVFNDINDLAGNQLPELWQVDLGSDDHTRTPARVARPARVLTTDCYRSDINGFEAARVRLEQIDGPARDGSPDEAPDDQAGSPILSELATRGQRRLHRATGTAGLPREWIDGAMRLSAARLPCPGFRDGQWPRTYGHIVDFLTGTLAVEAAALDWSTELLFGVHPTVGIANVSCCGACILADRMPIIAIERDAIRFDRLTFYRPPARNLSVTVWDFGR